MAELEIQEDDLKKIQSTTPQSNQNPTVQNDSDEINGCKTPTSLDHKIPVVKYTLCPPAPRKPPPNRFKRKLNPVNYDNRIQTDLNREIEMFFEDLDRRIKKSRKLEDEYW